jgi:hypothetical protein
VDSRGAGALCRLILGDFSLCRLPLALPPTAQFALAPDGTAFFADISGGIHVADPAAQKLTAWGRPGTAARCVGLTSDAVALYSVWEHAAGGSLAVFDRNGRLTRESDIGGVPTGVTVDHRGRLYIPFTAGAGSGEGVLIQDAAQTGGETCVVAIRCSGCAATSRAYPIHVAVAPDGQTAYVCDEDAAAISIIDLGTMSLRPSIVLGRSISRLALLPGGYFAVATSNMFADLCLVDLVNGRLLAFTVNDREITQLAVIDQIDADDDKGRPDQLAPGDPLPQNDHPDQ